MTKTPGEKNKKVVKKAEKAAKRSRDELERIFPVSEPMCPLEMDELKEMSSYADPEEKFN